MYANRPPERRRSRERSTRAARRAPDSLLHSDAIARTLRVSNVSYDLHFSLGADTPRYSGDVTVHFSLIGNGDLFLDHYGGGVESIEINGARVEHDPAAGRLTLPHEALAERNSVRVVFSHAYDHGQYGFMRRVDEDGSEYLYTNFEPFAAHRLFPCFDQPDLKATYNLTVDAPSEWEVIANTTESEHAMLGDGRARRRFTRSERFSPYLFALFAGPYHAVQTEHHGIPLGLYCRASIADRLDADELFDVTRHGLDFYADFFDYGYPFHKYDQVFVPDFHFGSMENVAAISAAEWLLHGGDSATRRQRNRAPVLLHEMSHMWIGNLVTAHWWDDVWLSEGLASHLAAIANAGFASGAPDAPQMPLDLALPELGPRGFVPPGLMPPGFALPDDGSRHLDTRGLAPTDFGAPGSTSSDHDTFTLSPIIKALRFAFIATDSLPLSPADYRAADSVLDGVSAQVGKDGFQAGLREYVRAFAFSTATLTDFFRSFSRD